MVGGRLPLVLKTVAMLLKPLAGANSEETAVKVIPGSGCGVKTTFRSKFHKNYLMEWSRFGPCQFVTHYRSRG